MGLLLDLRLRWGHRLGRNRASRTTTERRIQKVVRRLDQAQRCVEDRVETKMRFRESAMLAVVALAFCTAQFVAATQTKDTPPPAHPNGVEQTSRITIEVSGGEDATPVENASIYIKYIEERKVKKDKKTELNVKTNREGAAHVPEAPMGRVLVQVVAEGWKTFGRWYDINEAKQTIKIHLDKPPRWY
jgi:hypothetical protein